MGHCRSSTSVRRGTGVPNSADGSPGGGTGTLLFSSAEGTCLERVLAPKPSLSGE